MRSILLVILLGVLQTAGFGGTPVFHSELIFPPENIHNHSSSIVETPNGDLLVCWYHGSGERTADDVKILGSRRHPGQSTWESPFLMADVPGFPDTNPTMVISPENKLFIFWANIVANQWGTALLRMKTSTDFEQASGPPRWNWQDVILLKPINFEQEFVQKAAGLLPLVKKHPEFKKEIEEAICSAGNKFQRRIGWMPRIHPLILPSGRMLLPLYSDVFSVSVIAISDDQGKTWFASEPLLGIGNVQPSLVLKKDGTIAAYMRDNGPGLKIQYSESTDQGVHWSNVRYLNIPNPGSSVDVISLKNGHWVLVCNNTTDGRYRLAVFLSEDEGQSWPWMRYLEKAAKDAGSYCYPSVIQTRDGLIHVSYSWNEHGKGQSIKHAEFNEDWVRRGN